MSTQPLTNVHPVDELHSLREEIAQIEKRAEFLRSAILSGKCTRTGAQYEAVVMTSTRDSLDRKALVEAFGEATLAPFTRTTSFQTVKIKEIERAEG